MIALIQVRQEHLFVYGPRLLDENTSHRPLGEKLCQESIRGVFPFSPKF